MATYEYSTEHDSLIGGPVDTYSLIERPVSSSSRVEMIAHTFVYLSMHSPEQIHQKLRTLIERLKQRYPIQSMALFGSVTREDFGPESDIDILVEFDGTIGSGFIDLALELESHLGRKVDLVSRRGIRDQYYQEIVQDLQYV